MFRLGLSSGRTEQSDDVYGPRVGIRNYLCCACYRDEEKCEAGEGPDSMQVQLARLSCERGQQT